MAVVELDGGAGGVEPDLGPLFSEVVVGRLGDGGRLALGTHPHQHVRVRPALQHSQVGSAQVTGQRGHGHERADQVLDADLVLGAGLGEAVRRPHPAVQRRPLHAGQLEGMQTGGVDEGQAGQGVGVDAVCLGVAAEEPP